jgi:hypothetical protein
MPVRTTGYFYAERKKGRLIQRTHNKAHFEAIKKAQARRKIILEAKSITATRKKLNEIISELNKTFFSQEAKLSREKEQNLLEQIRTLKRHQTKTTENIFKKFFESLEWLEKDGVITRGFTKKIKRKK